MLPPWDEKSSSLLQSTHTHTHKEYTKQERVEIGWRGVEVGYL
jgi:hypothetical protein